MENDWIVETLDGEFKAELNDLQKQFLEIISSVEEKNGDKIYTFYNKELQDIKRFKFTKK